MPSRERAGTVTMQEVADAAGVGIGTVSRVVNGGTGVSARTRKNVEAAIVRLGFNPNPIAQSMRSGRTKTFACIVRDFSVPVLSTFVNAMQTALDQTGFSLQVASSYHDVARELTIISSLTHRRADGLVIASSSEEDPALLNALSRASFAVVLLDRDRPAGLDAVLIDHRSGVRSATSYLLSLGHRRIAVLAGGGVVRPVTARLDGYREAFRARNLDVPEELICRGTFGPDYAYSETMQLLGRSDRPTAIFAGGTAMLASVLKAIRDSGLRMPEDISLISGADSELALLHTPAITVVRWHHDYLGAMAAKFLLNRLERRALGAQRMIFPTELVLRDSCAAVPG